MIYDHSPITTPDATPLAIATVEIPDLYGGQLVVDVIGVQDNGGGSVSTRIMVTFHKASTLTIGTETAVHADYTGIAGAAVSLLVNGDENIEVEATGSIDVINWVVRTEILLTNATTSP